MNPDSWSTCTPLTRRTFMAGAILTGIGLATPSALAQVSFAEDAEDRNVLVVIFLRGGADGLSILAPVHDADYAKARPSLALKASETLKLTDYFSAHPSMKSLLPYWESGELGFVPACGSGDITRSHFEAMGLMERGMWTEGESATGGWLGRYLSNYPGGGSPMRAVALGGLMPESLSGGTGALALSSLADFRLDGGDDFARDLARVYRGKKDSFGAAAEKTLGLLKTLQSVGASSYKPANGAIYPTTSDLGEAMKQVAILIKAGVGLEVACLDKGGWDTHVTQGGTTGFLANNIEDVSTCLAAFARDLGDRMKRVTVVVQTEFGRRVEENSGLGTDHGRASVLWLLGGGVQGGKVHGAWPGLRVQDRDSVGDLRVANDYRAVLSEVLRKRMKADPAGIFAGYSGAELGVLA